MIDFSWNEIFYTNVNLHAPGKPRAKKHAVALRRTYVNKRAMRDEDDDAVAC